MSSEKILLLIFTFTMSLNKKVSAENAGPSQPNSIENIENNINEERYKILVTHPEVPHEAIDIMSASCDVIICQSVPPNRAEILEKAKGVDALFWTTHEPLNTQVLDAVGPQLKAISTMSAGFDHVDVPELKRRKIPLGHTPKVLNNAVANVAIGLMIAAGRRFHEGREKIATSTWENYHIDWMWGQDIQDSVVGFYGFGNIGRTIAKRLSSFDIDSILYTTRHRVARSVEEEFNAVKVPLDSLVEQSDYIFIAAPLTDETRGVFNASAFEKMKNTSVLINIGRGAIVNQDDLYTALKTNQIFAAGLDVMAPEPLPANHKLLSLPNCVLTPHIGSATKTTRRDISIVAAHNILRCLSGEPMFSPAYVLDPVPETKTPPLFAI